MILNQQLILIQEQAVTDSAPSTNHLDIQTACDLAMGETLHLGITMLQAPRAEKKAKVTLKVQVADDAAFTQNLTTTTQTEALPLR